jgi:hypothetical protein
MKAKGALGAALEDEPRDKERLLGGRIERADQFRRAVSRALCRGKSRPVNSINRFSASATAA